MECDQQIIEPVWQHTVYEPSLRSPGVGECRHPDIRRVSAANHAGETTVAGRRIAQAEVVFVVRQVGAGEPDEQEMVAFEQTTERALQRFRAAHEPLAQGVDHRLGRFYRPVHLDDRQRMCWSGSEDIAQCFIVSVVGVYTVRNADGIKSVLYESIEVGGDDGRHMVMCSKAGDGVVAGTPICGIDGLEDSEVFQSAFVFDELRLVVWREVGRGVSLGDERVQESRCEGLVREHH